MAGEAAVQGTAPRPWLVINPLSFRASRGDLARRVGDLGRRHGLQVVHASTPQEFTTTFARLRAQRAAQIWMLAGDGTIHALAQYLAQPECAGWSPALLLLGGGRANVVPRDSGGYPAWDRLKKALVALQEGRPLQEDSLPTLRVEQQGSPPQHGFFLAGAAIHAGVRLCREHRASGTGWLHRSWIADPWCLLKLAAQVLTGRSPLPPHEQMLVTTAEGRLQGTVRVLISSSLPLRGALYNPFAARGEGPVRITAVAGNAARFWRNLPAILMGRFGDNMTLQHGYLSGRFADCEILGMKGYALDGEMFSTHPDRPVLLTPGIVLRILRP